MKKKLRKIRWKFLIIDDLILGNPIFIEQWTSLHNNIRTSAKSNDSTIVIDVVEVRDLFVSDQHIC